MMGSLFKILLFIGVPVIVSNLGHGILKGKVKSMTYAQYSISRDSSGTLDKSIKRADYTEYTITGKIAIQYTAVWFGKEYNQSINHYNGMGLVLDRYTYHRNISDSNIHVMLQDTSSLTSWREKTIYTYNKSGLLAEQKTYKRFFDNDSLLLHYIIYTYDSFGNKKRFDSINIGGSKIVKTVDHIHDSVILVPASDIFLPDSPFSSKPVTTSKYYSNGKKREQKTIFQTNTRIDRYNRKGLLTEIETNFNDGSLREISIYSHNKRGDEIINYYDTKGFKDITINKYTYDKIGNKLIDSVFDNDRLIYIQKRELEYW